MRVGMRDIHKVLFKCYFETHWYIIADSRCKVELFFPLFQLLNYLFDSNEV